MNRELIAGDYISMLLRQIGADDIKKLDSHLNIVRFYITEDITVSYVFNITKNDKYFLQRMQPYAIPQGKFATAEEIIDFINMDVSKYRNAAKSVNFEKFVRINEKCNIIVAKMEALFLNHNVETDMLNEINERLVSTIKDIEEKNLKLPTIKTEIVLGKQNYNSEKDS